MSIKEYVSPLTDPYLLSNEPWNVYVAIVTGILNQKLYDYQCEILRAVAYYDRVAVVASRQIGKSVTIAFLALAWALSKPNQTVLIISTGERQVKELLSKRNYSVKKIYKRSGDNNIIHIPYQDDTREVLRAFGQDCGLQMDFHIPKEFQPRGDGGEVSLDLEMDFSFLRENSEEVEFPNGSRIVVVPSNPDTAAGFTANLVIGDEIAKMQNWPEVWSAIQPMVSRTEGTVALFSSYKGKNHWWDITQDKRDPETNPFGWTVLKYDILVNPPSNLEQIKHDLPESVFNEEYMCIPVDEYHSLFPFSVIDKCSTGTFDEWF